jgi:hypothetical protein
VILFTPFHADGHSPSIIRPTVVRRFVPSSRSSRVIRSASLSVLSGKLIEIVPNRACFEWANPRFVDAKAGTEVSMANRTGGGRDQQGSPRPRETVERAASDLAARREREVVLWSYSHRCSTSAAFLPFPRPTSWRPAWSGDTPWSRLYELCLYQICGS